jgi:hypothetical protein
VILKGLKSTALIIITENKMNFQALPPLPATIEIWSGGGFMVSFLKKIVWIERLNFLFGRF